jgi:hypothetical protein
MTMSAEATAAIAVLEELAIRLGADGWQVQLHAPPDRRPMLHVTNPRVMVLSELVTADLDADGRWWFWWSWAERISRAGDLDRAAGVISRVLAAGHRAQLSGVPPWQRAPRGRGPGASGMGSPPRAAGFVDYC